MINIIGNVITDIKDDLAKTIEIQINLDDLAEKLYPRLQRIDARNPQNFIKKHLESLSKQFNSSKKRKED